MPMSYSTEQLQQRADLLAFPGNCRGDAILGIQVEKSPALHPAHYRKTATLPAWSGWLKFPLCSMGLSTQGATICTNLHIIRYVHRIEI